MWKPFYRKGFIEARPYVPGEDLKRISVNGADTLETGGMIARNPNDHKDQWYIAKDLFKDHYELR